MAPHDAAILPPPSPEHRRAAAGRFERALQVIATGNYDYGIQLLFTCCQLDPANLIYRQRLRQTEKTKYHHNLRGSRLAFLTTLGAKARLQGARRTHDHLKVLEYGEEVLLRNPWDRAAQIDMAEAAQKLDLFDLAIWILEHAREKDPLDVSINRRLARFQEQCGHLTQAARLWKLVHEVVPGDAEAHQKVQELAAVKGPEEVGRDQEDVLQAAIENDPTNAQPYLSLAKLYRSTGRLDEARNVLVQGLGPTGRHFDLATALGELEIEPFRHNLALVEEKLRSGSPEEELHPVRLRLLKEINTRELNLYRQKADRFPTDAGYRLELGIRLLRAGQLDEAIQELQAAQAEPQYHWRACIYLGSCYTGRNNWRLAERYYEAALANLPDEEEAAKKELLFQLAHGAARAGDLARAVEQGTKLADLDRSYRGIDCLLAQWQSQLTQAGHERS